MKSIPKPYLFALKLIAVIVLIGYLVFKIKNEPVLTTLNSLKIENYSAFISCIILVFINWGLEAKKWELMLKPIQKLSFLKSYKSVLSGLATGLLTPNRLGNFLGRLAYIKTKYHNQAIIHTQIGNLAQFISTILVGIIGLFVISWFQFNLLNPILVGVISVLFLCIGLLFYFKPNTILHLPFSKYLNEKTQKSLVVVTQYSTTFKFQILALSIFRYLVFTIQYYALFFMFNPIHSLQLLCLISITFLLTTIIPSFFFGKLFVRESVAVFTFSFLNLDPTLIILVAFLLWMINLAIPAIFGALFWLKQKHV